MEKYQKLIQSALLNVVKKILQEVSLNGLIGEQHFFIAFDTNYPSISIPSFLKDRYPEEMTIVLQHDFENLEILSDSFSVILHFNGKPEKLTVPFKSILTFADPSEQFVLQFMPSLMKDPEDKEKTSQSHTPAQIINLDAMRNKK